MFNWLFTRNRTIGLRDIPTSDAVDYSIANYVAAMEKGKTEEWCRCTWVQNPFNERQKRRDDEHPRCPLHTREGLIVGFLDWVRDHR